MWLELADGEREAVNPYILVPGKGGRGMYVREDHFDHLPNLDFNRMMRNLAPFQKDVQTGQLSESEFLADRKARKEKRTEKKAKKTAGKDEKKSTKAEKKKTKVEKKKAKVDIKKAKAEKKRASGSAKQTRADAKMRKAEGSPDREGDEENESRGGEFFNKVKGIGGKLLNKYVGGGSSGGGDDEAEEAGGGSSASRPKKKASDDSEETPFYKKPAVLITGGVLLLAGVGYLATRKKVA